MASTLKLEVSGVTFSSLIFDMMNSKGDQEGFLFGNSRTKVIGDISDSQLNYQKEEFIVGIHQTMPCDQVYSFCNPMGVVNNEKFRKIIQAYKFQDLIGWYRFRRNTTLDVFFQERAIHQNLLKLLPNDKRSHFMFGIFTSSTSETIATHTIEHKFFRLNDCNFEPVPVEVINLGDTAHTNYKTDPPLVLNKRSGSYDEFICSIRDPILDKDGLTASMKHIRNVQASIQSIFNKLCKEFGDTEEEIERLQEEIVKLKSSHKPKELSKCTEVATNEVVGLTHCTIEDQLSKIHLLAEINPASLPSKDILENDKVEES
ncbi:hypothetical protein CHUAL_009317 [Chamberlinius hualienensis]